MESQNKYLEKALSLPPFSKEKLYCEPLEHAVLLALEDFFNLQAITLPKLIEIGNDLFEMRYFTQHLLQENVELFKIGDYFAFLKNNSIARGAESKLELTTEVINHLRSFLYLHQAEIHKINSYWE